MTEQIKQWKSCGYVAVSKKGTVFSIVIKNERYVVNLEDLMDVLDGKLNYALIREFEGEKNG
jgi:hypothetical protein